MSAQPNEDDTGSGASANVIAIAGLNVDSYENAVVDRLEKRLSESIVPEVKDRLIHHLEQTKEQQERIRERIKALGGSELGMEPTYEKGNYLYQNLRNS